MAFPPEFLDRLREQVPLADVVGRRVRLQRRGREHTGLCPFHNEKTPSFTVSEDKGFFHCFGCGAHGDVVGFVMRSEGLSFPEAVERLAHEAGLSLPRSSPEERQRERRRADLHEVAESACAWFEEQLRAKAGGKARAYLERRGVDEATAAAFRLGYAPDARGALRAALNARGYDDERLAAAGLVKRPEDGGEPRDYFFDRLIFPITDRRGRVIAFGGRALGDSPAKYLNSPDGDLFHKGRVVYNLARARQAARDSGELVVAEGYMDVIALAQAGFPAAVAPLGTAVTEDQLQELWRLAPEPVVCLDGDEAGRRAGARLAERALPLLAPGRSLGFAVLPQGEDPDSLVRGQGPQAMRAVLQGARPLADMLWLKETEGRTFDTPERRAGLRERLLQHVRRIRERTVQDAYRQEMERRFEAAFGYRRPPPRWQRRRGGRPGGPAPAGGGGWGAGRHSLPAAGGLGARQSPELLQRRQEQLILATAINHPGLLVEHAEDLVELALADAGLDRLRRALVDLAAAAPDLDSHGICCHLRQSGFAGEVKSLLCRDVYAFGAFARPDASAEDAEEGWRHVLALYRERRAREQAGEATRRLAQTMSEDDLARLQATQQDLFEAESVRVDLDGAHDGTDRRKPD